MKKKKQGRYQAFLYSALLLSVLSLITTTYFHFYMKVPSTIRIRAGVEETLDFGFPITGELCETQNEPDAITVSEQPESNVPREANAIPMNPSVTIKAEEFSTYQLVVSLFGVIPLKTVDVEVISDTKLIPAGIPIGIYVKTEGVLVVGIGEFLGSDGQTKSPAKYLLQSGDYILSVNQTPVESKNQLIELIEKTDGSPVVLNIKRDGQEFEIKATPMQNDLGEYKLGIWIRDNAQGIGTLTYVDVNANFGALGHGINDIDTSEILELKSGTLYETSIIAIRKGENGSPGEMTGMIEYRDSHIVGTIYTNNQRGIFGECRDRLMETITEKAVPIGLKQEIHLGEAQIFCSIENEPKYYKVEITDIRLDHDHVNRGIMLKITDEELLKKTGGIIQGMSGAPILQDGKIIGAVTHVLVQDCTSGYGIFIENMLTH